MDTTILRFENCENHRRHFLKLVTAWSCLIPLLFEVFKASWGYVTRIKRVRYAQWAIPQALNILKDEGTKYIPIGTAQTSWIFVNARQIVSVASQTFRNWYVSKNMSKHTRVICHQGYSGRLVQRSNAQVNRFAVYHAHEDPSTGSHKSICHMLFPKISQSVDCSFSKSWSWDGSKL